MYTSCARGMFELKHCFIIAELSANHGNDLEIALESVRAAKRAGADAIKLQTYTADTITLDVRTDLFRINQGTHWDGRYLYDLYREASLSWDWHRPIFAEAKRLGLMCFSSPFDKSAVDFLEGFNVPAYKIASFEITDVPLIRYVASKGKPVIISTGIATVEDIQLALDTCKDAGNTQVVLLHCTSEYPAAPENANLRTIADMRIRFGVEVGLSDHTMGIEAPVVAVSLGATVIEKHFILDKKIGGPDAHFSLDEHEFAQMVRSVRAAEKMLGKAGYDMTEKKKKSRQFSRSLFVAENVSKGDRFSERNVRSVRPGFGMHTRHFDEIIGRRASKDITKGTPLTPDLIAKD